MTEKMKIELKFEFKDFAQKYKNVLELKQMDAVNYRNLLTCKAIEEQTKDIKFSDNWLKELSAKCEELKPLAEEELKKASENVDKYLEKLIESIFEFHASVYLKNEDRDIKQCAKTIRDIVAAGGGQLQADFIFNVVKVLYLK